jgi:outer membrane protein TolC
MVFWLKTILPPLAALGLQAQAPLSIQDAIRQAWTGQSGLQAGAAFVEKANAEAAALKNLRLPTLTLGAGLTRTSEPMMAFGTRLDQARISAMDFQPSLLNHPDPITGAGATLTLAQPLYAGGRLDAARRAGAALAGSETAAQAHRRQQVALAVAQAYFGAQVADSALGYALDTLKQAEETEHFVQARVTQGLMLASEGDRTRAFRAQAQAGVALARQRAASARSALTLLMGADGAQATLTTPIDAPAAENGITGKRSDLEATRLQGEAAKAGVAAAQGGLKPEVGLNLTAGTARYALNGGGSWTTATLGAKWTFNFSDPQRVHAARAAARAAELGLKWQEAQAGREVQEARAGMATALASIAYAQEAVTASESVRAIRTARHREGLLPLMDVLDAESGLAGARTLLLNSQLEYRITKAQLALALGQPIEGVKE